MSTPELEQAQQLRDGLLALETDSPAAQRILDNAVRQVSRRITKLQGKLK